MNVMIYGAGAYGKKCYEDLVNIGYVPTAFVVSAKDKNPEAFFDVPVVSKDSLLAIRDKDNVSIYVALKSAERKTIKKDLENIGFANVFTYPQTKNDIFVNSCKAYKYKYIYGAGLRGGVLFSLLNDRDIDVDAFVVTKKSANASSFKDIPVLSLDEVLQNANEAVFILALKKSYREEVLELLSKHNIKNVKICPEYIFGKPKNTKTAEQNINDMGRKILLEQQNELSCLEQVNNIKKLKMQPKISVVMPVYNPDIKWLAIAIKSVQQQTYQNWELCLQDDGSSSLEAKEFILELQKEDNRLVYHREEKNSGISEATNKAISFASGTYIALMDQDDELPKDAFYWLVEAINKNEDIDLFYTDQCCIYEDALKDACDFYFKPDWSPELMINHMYTSHLSVYKTDFVKRLGGFRSEYDFSQDYDFALRAGCATDKIYHIERILYYWRKISSSAAGGGKDFARISNISALKDYFDRKSLPNIATMATPYNYCFVPLDKNPLVSIVIPSDSEEMIIKCVSGLTSTPTSYKNLEVVVVTNSKIIDNLTSYFPYLSVLKFCKYDKPYNFSDKCNEGVKYSNGEYVVIYNDDVYPLSTDWLERMIEVMQYPKVGGVSPMTVYENGKIQYAGMITGTPGLVGTSFNGNPYKINEIGPFNHSLIRDVSVLCGACMMMKKSLFMALGGFDSVNTPTGHSDVDLSFKILESGYRCVYTPYSILTHLGNHSWHKKDKADKADIFVLKKWGKYLNRDTYFTDSQKRFLYNDFRYKYKIFSPDKIKNVNAQKDYLIVSHELSLTGAPLVLVDVVEFLLEEGNYVVVTSPVDGPLRETFIKMGVTVIIDEGITLGQNMFERFARNFDMVIVNTLACFKAVELLSDSLPPVLWWLHEGSVAFNDFKDRLPKSFGSNIHIYCVSEYSKNILLHFIKDVEAQTLQCYVNGSGIIDGGGGRKYR